MTLTISRTFTLQAAHHLPATPPDHKCHRMHGHTWQCTVFVRGVLDPNLMWIIDYAVIDEAWKRNVYDVLDHRTLNDTIPNPTTEAMVFWIHQAMHPDIAKAGATIVRIELAEGPNNRCDLDIEQPTISQALKVDLSPNDEWLREGMSMRDDRERHRRVVEVIDVMSETCEGGYVPFLRGILDEITIKIEVATKD